MLFCFIRGLTAVIFSITAFDKSPEIRTDIEKGKMVKVETDILHISVTAFAGGILSAGGGAWAAEELTANSGAFLMKYWTVHHVDFGYELMQIVFMVLMLQILLADMKYYIIPDFHVICLLCLGIFMNFKELPQLAVGIFAGVMPMFFIIILGYAAAKKEIAGMGDVKLLGSLGGVIGSEMIFKVYLLTFLISGAAGAVFLLKGKKNMPLAPFIVLSVGLLI